MVFKIDVKPYWNLNNGELQLLIIEDIIDVKPYWNLNENDVVRRKMELRLM